MEGAIRIAANDKNNTTENEFIKQILPVCCTPSGFACIQNYKNILRHNSLVLMLVDSTYIHFYQL